jgi:hypothetical protein
MTLAHIAIALAGAWFMSKAWRLYVNYKAAAKSGLPYLIWPVDPENVRKARSRRNPQQRDLTLPSLAADLLHRLTDAHEIAIAHPSADIVVRTRVRRHHGLGV